jgi:predicted tellurium resistance membrane protein TerC
MTTTSPASTNLHRRRALVVLGAAAAATGVWAVVRQVGGIDLAVATASGPAAVGLPAVVLTALVVGLTGWAVLAGLERWTRRPHRTWRVLAAGVLVLSLLGPVATALSPASMGGLIALHVAVGAALMALPGRC